MEWLFLILTVTIFSMLFAGWFLQDRDEKRQKQQDKPPSVACPCGCARVGLYCARCGRAMPVKPAPFVPDDWESQQFKSIPTPAPPPDKPLMYRQGPTKIIQFVNKG